MGNLLIICFFIVTYAKELWDMVFVLFGISWVMPRRVIEMFACWLGKMGKHQVHIIWRAVPHCLMWCLWKERNRRIFEGCEQTVAKLKLLFLRTLFEWMASTRLFDFSSFLEFIDSCCF
jgi:hypothetical protein